MAQKVIAHGADWGQAQVLLSSYGLRVEPVTREDAEQAAAMWRIGSGLSLGDRLCLALGRRLGCDILTADRAWGDRNGVEQLRA